MRPAWNLRREVFGDEPTEAMHLMQWAAKASGLGQRELARRMGWSMRTVETYLQGRRPNVGWLVATRWLRVCGFRVIVDAEGRFDG